MYPYGYKNVQNEMKYEFKFISLAQILADSKKILYTRIV